MNYKRIYNALIERAKTRLLEGYVERHHIVPRCMGGSDDRSNLVALTPEEHFLAHVLLVKIHPEEKNLILAVQKMCRGRKGRRSRKMYGWLRRRHSERMSEIHSGEGNSQFGSRWVRDPDGVPKKIRGDLPLGWQEGRASKPERKPNPPKKRGAPPRFSDDQIKLAWVGANSSTQVARALGYKNPSNIGSAIKRIVSLRP